MKEKKETTDECRFDPFDTDGESNLCCCYTVDEDGNTTDPCYVPVEDSCPCLEPV